MVLCVQMPDILCEVAREGIPVRQMQPLKGWHAQLLQLLQGCSSCTGYSSCKDCRSCKGSDCRTVFWTMWNCQSSGIIINTFWIIANLKNNYKRDMMRSEYKFRHPKYKFRHPKYKFRRPKYKFRHPKYKFRHPKYKFRHPKYKFRHPKKAV